MNLKIKVLPSRAFKPLMGGLVFSFFITRGSFSMEADPHGTNKRLKSLKNNFHLQLKGDRVIDALHEDWQAGGNLIEHIADQLDQPQKRVRHTLFGCAVRKYNDSQFIRYLLENGASAGAICLGGEKGSHPVIRDVAEYGNPATLKLFIANGALGTGATYENCALSDWSRRNVLCAMINALRLCLHNPLCQDKDARCANYLKCTTQLLAIFKQQKLSLADVNDKDNKPYACVVDSGYEPLIKLFVSQCGYDFKGFVNSYQREKPSWKILLDAVSTKPGADIAFDLFEKERKKREAAERRKLFIEGKNNAVKDKILSHVTLYPGKQNILYLLSLGRH